MIEMTKVLSSNLSHLGYDKKNSKLYARFLSTQLDTWEYDNVTQEQFGHLLSVKSIGSVFNSMIARQPIKHPARKLKSDDPIFQPNVDAKTSAESRISQALPLLEKLHKIVGGPLQNNVTEIIEILSGKPDTELGKIVEPFVPHSTQESQSPAEPSPEKGLSEIFGEGFGKIKPRW